MNDSPPVIDAASVDRALAPKDAVRAIRAALRSGFLPETDHSRSSEPLENGELLLMPSEMGHDAGIKVLTVTPENHRSGLPRIQGVYILLDARTHRLRGLVDGPALTNLRTSSVSIAAVAGLLMSTDEPLDIVLHGAGAQGTAHLRTVSDLLAGIRTIRSATAVVRNTDRVNSSPLLSQVFEAGSPEATAATSAADLVICATAAREPLFDSSSISDGTVVVAVGSHEADARELPGKLLGRSEVVVEDVSTALRECGDIVLAISDGYLDADSLIPMSEVVTGKREIGQSNRPVVFKSSGMPWEDLVIASEIVRRHGSKDDVNHDC